MASYILNYREQISDAYSGTQLKPMSLTVNHDGQIKNQTTTMTIKSNKKIASVTHDLFYFIPEEQGKFYTEDTLSDDGKVWTFNICVNNTTMEIDQEPHTITFTVTYEDGSCDIYTSSLDANYINVEYVYSTNWLPANMQNYCDDSWAGTPSEWIWSRYREYQECEFLDTELDFVTWQHSLSTLSVGQTIYMSKREYKPLTEDFLQIALDFINRIVYDLEHTTEHLYQSFADVMRDDYAQWGENENLITTAVNAVLWYFEDVEHDFNFSIKEEWAGKSVWYPFSEPTVYELNIEFPGQE